jgi:IPT/TIG domain
MRQRPVVSFVLILLGVAVSQVRLILGRFQFRRDWSNPNLSRANMNPSKCALFTCLFVFFLISGCGGGSSSSSTPPPNNNPAPVVSSITPSTVTAGTPDTIITVSGTGFISSSLVQWNNAALATTFVSSTQLKATLPAANLAGSSTAAVSVQNPAPGGGTSPATTFTVSSPTPAISSISSISPQVVPTGAAATITITGTGFESNSVVMWNNSARPTTFVSATSLQVALTATDLQSQGTGSLVVNNPGPGASTSPGVPLTVTSQPIPTIQNVAVAIEPGLSGCQQLQATITGQNFDYNATVQVNGVAVQEVSTSLAPTSLVVYLPLGFVSKPGALTFTVTNPNVPLISAPFPYPSTAAPVVSLCTTPSPTTVFPNSSFSFTVQTSEVNSPGNGTLTIGSLPAGVTSATSNLPLPSAGTTVHLQAAPSTAAATYDVALTATVGSATATSDFNFTVSSAAPPTFYLSGPLQTVLGVPIGGSGSIQYSAFSTPNVDFDITPSVTGLPPGTTASFSPATFSVGQSVTVTLSAANNAPVTQNASVTLVGTPAAQTATASTSFSVDVTQPPGSLPGSRTDFVSTAGTPSGAAYDPTHNLIFVTVPDWNRVVVISGSTHKIVKSIPVRTPRNLDISPDYSQVWVQTASQLFYAINTSTLQANQYILPSGPVSSSGLPILFSHDTVLALSDRTVLFYFDDSGAGGGGQVGVWNPQTNKMTILASGIMTGWGIPDAQR